METSAAEALPDPKPASPHFLKALRDLVQKGQYDVAYSDAIAVLDTTDPTNVEVLRKLRRVVRNEERSVVQFTNYVHTLLPKPPEVVVTERTKAPDVKVTKAHAKAMAEALKGFPVKVKTFGTRTLEVSVDVSKDRTIMSAVKTVAAMTLQKLPEGLQVLVSEA